MKRRATNRIYHLAKKREWLANNAERINARRRAQRTAQPLLALKNRLRTRTAVAFQRAGYSKASHTCAIIGCEWAVLKSHIETQFAPGMSWDNRDLWHVDHIIPLSSAASEDELRRLCHFTNLQPLWAAENIRKHDRLPIAA